MIFHKIKVHELKIVRCIYKYEIMSLRAYNLLINNNNNKKQ